MASSSVVVWRRLREARGPGLLDHPAGVDRLLHRRHHQAGTGTVHGAVAELDDLGEVVPGVDVHDRERQLARPERLGRQVQHDDRVLAAREQQHGPLELGRDLTDDVDRLGLEGPEVGQLVVHGEATNVGYGRPPRQKPSQKVEIPCPHQDDSAARPTESGPARRTTGWRPRWPPRPASCWSSCGRGWWPTGPTRPTLKDEGDRRAHELIMARWPSGWRPATPCCPRRAATTPSGSAPTRVWIVDPLDGTREFGEPPRTDWAVHVALVDRRRAGRRRGGAARPRADPGAPTRPAACPTRWPARRGSSSAAAGRPAAATWLAEQLDGELVEMGSAGAKAMAVVRGEADVYAHSGRPVRVGLVRPGRGGPGRRAARLAPRRLAAGLQQRRSLPARPADLPPRAGRAGAAGPGRLRRPDRGRAACPR